MDLGSVRPQNDALRLGIGEQILHGPDKDSGPVGNGEPAVREQGSRIAVETVERSTWYSSASAVCGLVPQADQREQQPVGEDELRLASRTGRPLAGASTAYGTAGLLGRPPTAEPARR